MRLLSITTTLIILFSNVVFAQELESELSTDGNGGQVVVETPEDYTLNYKQRRTQNGFVFGLNSENYYPIDYQSQFADGYIEDIIGADSIKLIGVDLGYKYNVSVGSVSGIFSYASGSLGGTTAGRDISVQKTAFAANVAIDGVFDEPWVVPYAQFGMHQFSVSENKNNEGRSSSAGFSFDYRYGLLFQVDWVENLMDKSAKAERLRSSGLENTFIDFYYVTYMASSNAQDPSVLGAEGEPNTASADEMGLGLKLEF